MTTNINEISGVSYPSVSRPLRPGVYAPLPTFFLPDSEDLDITTFQRHVLYLTKSGMGLVVCGTMGEAHHLDPMERVQLIKAARQALDSEGFTHVPIIMGTGAGSTRHTIALTQQAAEAGADYAIVITSGYFSGSLDTAAIKTFFMEVAAASPIPVMIYNYPGASGGIDLDSDFIESVAKESPNVCGVKLTCGNVGKLVRIAATTSVPSFAKAYPRKNKDAPFLILGGLADFILPSAFVRGHGAITGLANITPYALVRLTELSFASTTDPSLLPEAQHLQDVLARADRTIALAGVSGTKSLLERIHSYGGAPRRPLQRLTTQQEDALWTHDNVQASLALEESCKLKAESAASLTQQKLGEIPTPDEALKGSAVDPVVA